MCDEAFLFGKAEDNTARANACQAPSPSQADRIRFRGRPSAFAPRMKALLLTLALLPATFATAALAEPLAIFARDDARKSIDAPPSDARAATFFATFFQDRSTAVPFEGSLALVNPPSWGKTISRTTGGGLTYHRSFAGGFIAKLTLHGLAPHHTYILTLNGNPELAGNELLLTPVPGLEEERYYDFLDIRTDADGRYEGELGVYLKSGDYAVRLYVKDTDDFKIVLYHDYFPFRVTP